jgi:uncharacterized damage-inducible protein DinB
VTDLAPLPTVRSPERQTLEEFLDFFRSVFVRKVEGIDDAQARRRVGASELDLLGLARHMAGVERFWFSQALDGSDAPELWVNPTDPDDPDADFHHQPGDTIAEAVAALHAEIAESRRRVAAHASLDEVTAIDVGPPDNPDRFGPRSLRWLLVHMIEEYARHCGHADILRETIDGATGD